MGFGLDFLYLWLWYDRSFIYLFMFTFSRLLKQIIVGILETYQKQHKLRPGGSKTNC